MRIRTIYLLILGVLLLGPVVGVAEEVKIGVYGPLTGPVASIALSQKRAAVLIAEEWNAKGGILGMPVKLIIEDDQANPSQSVNVIQKFVDKDKVSIIVGGFNSSNVMANSLVNEKVKIPQILSGALAEKITQRGLKYIFRPYATFDQLIEQLGEYWMTKTSYKRYAIFAEATDAGESIKDNFTKQIENRGGKIVGAVLSPLGTTDFYSRLTKIKEFKPEVIFVGHASEIDNGQVIRQANELGLKAIFTATQTASSDKLFNIVGDGAEGSVFTSYFEPKYPTTPLAENLVKAFGAKYREDPDAYAAKMYEAMDIAKHAIELAASIDPQKIRDSLASIKNYPGISSATTFAENGQAFKKDLLVIVKGRKRVPIK